MAVVGKAEVARDVSDTGLFTRKSSGLVREIGLGGAVTISLAAISLGAVVVVFPASLATFPHSSLTVPIILAGLLLIPVTLVYGQLTAAMPRSGGDYVFVGRILHPALGAAVGFALLVTIAYGVGFTASWIGSTYGPTSLLAIDSALHIHTFDSAATSIATQSGQFWTGVPVIIFAGLIALRGARALTRGQMICVGLGMVSVVVMVFTFFVHSHGAFVSAFNHAASKPNAYNATIKASVAGGGPVGTTTSGILAVFPFAVMLYLGWNYVVYPSGEVKTPGRTVNKAILVGLGVAFLVYIFGWLGWQNLVGLHFAQASSWLSFNDPTTVGHITSLPLTPNGDAFLMMGNPVSKLLLALLPLWVVAVELEGVLVVSRILFALSFDRLLPRALTRVSPRSHSPVIAVVVTVIGLVACEWAGIYTGVGTAFRNSILILLAVMVTSSVAATLLPWMKRDLYAAAPKPFGKSWFGVPPIAIVGAFSTVFLGIIFFLAATRPKLSGGYDTVSVIVLLSAAFGGIIAYVISKLALRRRGTDLTLAMRELPPD